MITMKEFSLFSFLFLVLFFGLTNCSDEDQLVTPPDNTGNGSMDTMDTSGNNPRTYSTESFTIGDWGIEIYVPSDYDSTEQYPVIYFNDGDLYADVFGFLPTLEAPAFIMVGISGSNDRAERFSPYDDPVLGNYTPSADIYSDAIVNEIMPFVEDRYSINNFKKAIFGISLGGLHATWLAIKYPNAFNFVGAISPSYWVANEAIFGEDLSGLNPPGVGTSTKVYFDRGSSEWRNHLSFVSKLKATGLNYGQSIFYYEVLGADHTTEDWLIRIDNPFRLFIEGIDFSDEPTDLDFRSYCAFDLTNNDAKTTRANPIIYYENGIRFSVMPEAEYTITQGSGSIADDGTYNISNGSSMVVEAAYKGLTDVTTLNTCN